MRVHVCARSRVHALTSPDVPASQPSGEPLCTPKLSSLRPLRAPPPPLHTPRAAAPSPRPCPACAAAAAAPPLLTRPGPPADLSLSLSLPPRPGFRGALETHARTPRSAGRRLVCGGGGLMSLQHHAAAAEEGEGYTRTEKHSS